MAENVEKNPFSALFASVDEAATFTHQVCGPSHIDVGLLESNSEKSSHSAFTTKSEGTYENEAKEKLEVNKLVEQVFNLTLNKNLKSSQNVVYLGDFASSIAQDWIDIDTLEQALFERLLLDNPSDHVLQPSQTSRYTMCCGTHATQRHVIIYLFECFKRLTKIQNSPDASEACREDIVKKMIELVLRNSATTVRHPELFEGQDIHSQIIDLLSENDSANELTLFFKGIAAEFARDDGLKGSVHSLLIAFHPTLERIHKEMALSGLFSFKQSNFELIHIFSKDSQLASVLLAHSTPPAGIGVATPGKVFADTLLGSALSISCLPKTVDGMYEYFDNMHHEAPTVMEENVWRAIQTIQENIFQVFHSLLKCSAEIKHKTLYWLADCLYANTARGQLWNSHSAYPSPESALCISDAFVLNLSGVLLRLSQPFCSNAMDPKLLRIDPTYCAALVGSEDDIRSKGIHMRAMNEETCLIPAPENVARPAAETFGFVTECFFMVHRALDLGFRVLTERLLKLNQDIARIQRVLQDAEPQGRRPAVRQALQDRLEMDLTKYQCLKAALLEPKGLEMMAQLHVATSMWLVQVAVTPISLTQTTYAPNTFKTITFPLKDGILTTLSCVPEFLVENSCGFLSFVRRFNPRTLEVEGFAFLDPFLTMLLVFMGSVERMRNPHLRALMAEALEAMLPENKNQTQMPPQLSFYRERLFKEHPHRKQIVVNLLTVFIDIEMTGQSVAFEQKFNYRRPMYIVMEYLWRMDEHQQCFQNLAVEAEGNMEAITPPLFLRFVNLLINDAVFLLDEALTNMAQLRQMQNAREAGEWQQLSLQEREQNEGYLQHIGMIARFDNILGRETIQTLKFLTSRIKTIFCHPTMVNRVAAMLNYFLYHLVGPKMKNFKVKDQKEFEFEPANIVLDICTIYVHLYKSDSFCLAVSQDGRSYSPQLFQLAEDVLVRIGGASLITDLQNAATKVLEMSSKQQTEDELLSEAPEEFLDPIMNTLMTDPVILPSSHTTLDRTTIARHLLSDQSDPFNRSPLTMDLVKSNNELRLQIEAWIREKRDQRVSSTK